MENKYYTPDISEFHVGFEFESNYTLFSADKEWHKVTLIMPDCEWFWSEYLEDATESEFRVKYLDREDIESLGWEEKEPYIFTIKDTNLIYRLLFTGFDVYRIRIFEESTPIKQQIFVGKIRNKSELKILMNQLRIK